MTTKPSGESTNTRPSNVRWLIFALASGSSFMLYLHRYTWGIIKPQVQEETGWSEVQLGWLDSMFSVSYAIGQIPSGVLCDWFGPHVLLSSIILMWSLSMGALALFSSYASMSASRFVFGLTQAVCYPTLGKVSKLWFPASVRTSVQGWISTFFGRGGGQRRERFYAAKFFSMSRRFFFSCADNIDPNLGWMQEVCCMNINANIIDDGQSITTSDGPFPRYLKNFDSVHAVSAANPAELTFYVKEPGTLGSVFSMAMRLFSAADGTGDYLTIKMDANPPSDRFISMHTDVGGFTALPAHEHTQTEGSLRITTEPSGTTFELQDPGTGNWTTTGFKDVGLSSVASVRLITDNTGGFMDSVVLNLVPEPSTWLLLGIGLLTLAFFRRRRQ